jgi:hypothetical protein
VREANSPRAGQAGYKDDYSDSMNSYRTDPRIKPSHELDGFKHRANYPSVIKVDFKPTYIKQLGGVWLLVADGSRTAHVYSTSTLRHVI